MSSKITASGKRSRKVVIITSAGQEEFVGNLNGAVRHIRNLHDGHNGRVEIVIVSEQRLTFEKNGIKLRKISAADK